MRPGQPTLGRMAAVSLAVHVLAMVLAAGTSLFQRGRFVQPNPYFVDLVASPAPKRRPPGVKKPVKKAKAPAKKPVAKKPAKKEKPREKAPPPPKSDRPALKARTKAVAKPVEDRVRSEIDRLKAIRRLERLRDLRSVVDVRKDGDTEDATDMQAPDGAVGSGDRTHVYYGVITHRVWEHWTYAGNPRPEWEALVYINVDDQGNLLQKRVEKSSGDEEFDRSVLRALAKAAPFPPPPEGIDRQIIFRFRP